MNAARGVVVAHPTGNENTRRLLAMLVREELLKEFRTTIGFDSVTAGRSLTYRLLGANAAKRVYAMLGPGQLRQRPARELVRNAMAKMPIWALRRTAEFDGPFNVDWVGRGLDDGMAHSLGGASAFYGYSGFTHSHVEAAAAAGVPAFVEVQHALWRATQQIADDERLRSPEWASTVPPRIGERKRELEDRELRAATVAVSPSRQVSESIRTAHPGIRIVHAPYGSPPPAARPRTERPASGARPRVLFVGRVVALKGAADLLHLAKTIGPAMDLSIIGPVPAVRTGAMADLLERSTYLGVLPRAQVLEHMAAHDLLVAPSLVEGRSLSVLEAVGQGTPIVVTPGTGADDLAERGAGLVVPSAAPDELVAAVDRMISDPADLWERRSAALEVARTSGWDGFDQPILDELRRLI